MSSWWAWKFWVICIINVIQVICSTGNAHLLRKRRTMSSLIRSRSKNNISMSFTCYRSNNIPFVITLALAYLCWKMLFRWPQSDIRWQRHNFTRANPFANSNGLFTLAILCLTIDILGHVLNWWEHRGQTAANHKRIFYFIDCHGYIAYTKMTIATYKIARVNRP